MELPAWTAKQHEFTKWSVTALLVVVDTYE